MAEITPALPPSPLPRRGMAGALGAVLAGLAAGGLGWLSLVLGQSYKILYGFVLVMPMPLFMAGLGLGRSDALVAALVAIGTLTVIFGLADMAMLTALFVLPPLLLSLLALRYRYDGTGALYWYPAGRLVAALVLYPLIVLGCFALFTSGHPGGMGGMLQDMLQPAIAGQLQSVEAEQALRQHGVTATPDLVKETTGLLVKYMPGFIVLTWIVTILVNALWTQFTLLTNRTALRPMPSLTEFDLPPWLLLFFAIMVLLAGFFDGQLAYYASNTLLPLTVPYFIVGASLMHFWAGRRKHKLPWLLAFYLLLLMLGWPVVLVAAIGVLEPWLHIRRRIAGQPKLST